MTPWKYYIMDEQGRTARIVNGVVQYLTPPAPLPQTPDGWQDILIGWERNMTRYGNMRNFSLPMGFVMNGATILRDGLYKSNVDKKLFLLIQRRVLELDPVYFRDYYKFFYKGQIDFTSTQDKQGESRFEVGIMEGGMWKLLKAKEDTVYSIPLDDDAIEIQMDGIEIEGNQPYSVLDVAYNADPYLYFAFSLVQLAAEGTSSGLNFYPSYYESMFDLFEYLNTSSNYFLSATQPVTVNLTGSFPLQLTTLRDQTYINISIIKTNANVPADAGNITYYYIFNTNQGPGPYDPPFTTEGEIRNIEFDLDIALAPGDRLFWYAQITQGSGFGDPSDWAVLENGRFAATYTNTYPPTTIKAFLPYVLFQKLVEKITGSVDNAVSSILQTSTYAVTSGDAIRGFESAEIKTSLKEFFTAFNVYHMLGMGVENDKITIEARSHFWKHGNPIDCGETKDMIISPATDLMFSRLKIGHAEQSIEDVNGKFDFNGYHNYSSPIESVSNELDLVSPYKAGPYEIEFIRINLEGKESTDDNKDNTVYVIDVKEKVNVYTDSIRFLEDIGFPYSITGIANSIPLYEGATFTTDNPLNPGPFTVEALIRIPFLPSYSVVVTEPVIGTDFVSTTITITSKLPYELRRDITVTAGVPSPSTIFNVALSPARLLRVHGGWLRGILEGYQASSLVLNSGMINNPTLVAGGIVEAADVKVNTLDPAMLSPWYFEYGTQVPISLVEELETDQNRSFSGEWLGIPFEGFGINTGLAPNSRQEQTFKILLAPGQDIKNFIT